MDLLNFRLCTCAALSSWREAVSYGEIVQLNTSHFTYYVVLESLFLSLWTFWRAGVVAAVKYCIKGSAKLT